MTFLWIVLAIVYVACWLYFGLATFRKGHYWLFWIGFFSSRSVDHRRVHCAYTTRGGTLRRGVGSRGQPKSQKLYRPSSARVITR